MKTENVAGGCTIPYGRRSTDPESPTFEPTAMIEMDGKSYCVHLDVWTELQRLYARLNAAVPVLDALDALADSEGLIPGLADGPEKDELESALAEARLIP